jgi:hypothetical protein
MISIAAKLARSTTSLRNAATASKIHGNAVADVYKIHASMHANRSLINKVATIDE